MDEDFSLVINQRAGASFDEGVAVAERILARYGSVKTTRCRDIHQLKRSIETHERGTLVVGGGDGSLHAVLQLLRDLGRLNTTTIGLLPLGIGNDFARHLGIPLEISKAATLVAAGSNRLFDLIVASDGNIIVNVAHCGMGFKASRFASHIKPFFGRRSYQIGAALAGLRSSSPRYSISTDNGTTLEGPMAMIAICNGGTIGGGTEMLSAARADDGMIEILAVMGDSPRRRIQAGLALRRGNLLSLDGVEHLRCSQVNVEGELGYVIDGELFPELSNTAFTLVPSCWRLVTPAHEAH